MLILDCESYEKTGQSVCRIFDIQDSSFVDFLSHVDLDEVYERLDHPHALIEALERQLNCTARPFVRVAWFHLTRVPKRETFAEGILPLNLALPKIWESVFSIFGDTQTGNNLRVLKEIGVPNYHYNLRTGNPIHFGPHTMLVRESAFRSEEMWNHDYLRLPELIEDISLAYSEQFHESIEEQLSAVLKPCIVKFELDEPPDKARADLAPAFRYCYSKARNEPMSNAENTCFDGGGVTVPHSAITDIQWL